MRNAFLEFGVNCLLYPKDEVTVAIFVGLSVLERKISTRQTREELIKKGVLILDQGLWNHSLACFSFHSLVALRRPSHMNLSRFLKHPPVGSKSKTLSLTDETIGSENLNGHATSSVTSEEVKVDVESPETALDHKASGPDGAEDKAGNSDASLGPTWSTACDTFLGSLVSLTV